MEDTARTRYRCRCLSTRLRAIQRPSRVLSTGVHEPTSSRSDWYARGSWILIGFERSLDIRRSIVGMLDKLRSHIRTWAHNQVCALSIRKHVQREVDCDNYLVWTVVIRQTNTTRWDNIGKQSTTILPHANGHGYPIDHYCCCCNWYFRELSYTPSRSVWELCEKGVDGVLCGWQWVLLNRVHHAYCSDSKISMRTLVTRATS